MPTTNGLYVGDCRRCKETIMITVPVDGVEKWLAGTPIQTAMPKLSPDEREFMISGTCGPCFDRIFFDD